MGRQAGSPDGPIARRWNVSGWPTIYLLDKQGVIRERDPRGERMREAVLEGLRGGKDG